jgi:hypothetical protein
MTQITVSKPVTYYVDNSHVRAFLAVAGEVLEALTEIELWDIITVVCQGCAIANTQDSETIDIEESIGFIEMDVSELAKECLETLNGMKVEDCNPFMKGCISVGFGV